MGSKLSKEDGSHIRNTVATGSDHLYSKLNRGGHVPSFSVLSNSRSSLGLDGVNIGLFSEQTLTLIEEIARNGYSFVPKRRLLSIAACVGKVERREVPGVFLEAGTARGGSAAVIGSSMGQGRRLKLYDVFSVIPAPDEVDGAKAKELYNNLNSASDPALRRYMKHASAPDPAELTEHVIRGLVGEDICSRIELLPGLVQDTLRETGPVAFAHIDLDWYEPTLHALREIEPNLQPGAILIIDDVYHWPGCRLAVEEHFSEVHQRYIFDSLNGHLVVERLP